MSRLLLLVSAVAALALSGCGDRSERAYYRSRYVPENIEDTYSTVKRAQWRGDSEVYELPATPPALDGVHYERVNCDLPGPKFKAQTVAGIGGEVVGTSRPEGTLVGAMDTRPVPVGALDPLPGYAVGGQSHIPPKGVYDTTYPVQDPSGFDRRPRVIAGEGIDSRQGDTAGAMRPMEKTDYCLPSETPSAPTTVKR